MEEVSGHYIADWGDLRSADGELASLGDLIRLVGIHHELPLRPAANRVLKALKAAPHVAVYFTRPADFAWKVTEVSVWSKKPPPYVGRLGCITALAKLWTHGLRSIDDLYPLKNGGAPALLMGDAAELFPELFSDHEEEPGGDAASVQGQVLSLLPSCDKAAELAAIAAAKPPAGFIKGRDWTPAYRAALLAQYDRLLTVCQSSEVALIHLHRGWGYSKDEGKNGGPLAKVLTKARAEAKSGKVMHLSR